MNDQSDVIEAQTAPLSHLAKQKSEGLSSFSFDLRSVAVTLVVIVAIGAGIYFMPVEQQDRRFIPSVAEETEAEETSPTPANTNRSTHTPQKAPFAQAQHQLAREKAQATLAEFVEKQILLQDTMQVSQWGEQEMNAALAHAKTGDEEFVREQFDAAILAYEQAATLLQEVIELGDEIFTTHLDKGKQHIAELDYPSALDALERALAIKPKHSGALASMQRAQHLPEIVALLRTAKNHELSNEFSEALAIYDQITQIDAATTGLAQLRENAFSAQAGDTVNTLLGQGFNNLEQKNYDGAKRAFNRALAMDPNNNIAKGGIQQVSKARDLAIIRQHEQDADAYLTAENWQKAIDAYASVLQLDSNIQFAKSGMSVAKAHLRAEQLLQKIVNAPQKLSSERLYLDAEAIHSKAKQLQHAGPQVGALINRVGELLEIYRNPVDLVLISDNATEVIISNIGALGSFERKTLSLRPGAYTIRGSQNGCRDILLNVEVLPGIEPLDVRCLERLQ